MSNIDDMRRRFDLIRMGLQLVADGYEPIDLLRFFADGVTTTASAMNLDEPDIQELLQEMFAATMEKKENNG